MSDWSDRLLARILAIGPSRILNHQITFDNSEFGPISGDQLRNAARLIIKSQAVGVDPKQIFAIVDHESSFESDPGGNGGGLGQFLESTAKGYNSTQEQLRHDSDKAADLIIRLYQDNVKAVGGDPVKATAAYFIGAGTVNDASKMPGDWIDNANTLAAKRWGQTPTAVSDYLTSTHQVDPKTYSRNKALAPPGSADYKTTSTTDTGKIDTTTVDPNNFWRDSVTGYPVPAGTPGAIWDQSSYEDTKKKHHDNQMSGLSDISQYMQNLVAGISAQIASKNLTLDEASKEFTKRLDVFKAGNEALSSFSRTGDKAGSKYRQGRGPNDALSNLGAHPIGALETSGINYNPMQTALDLTHGIPDYQSIGTVDTSAIGNVNQGPPPGTAPPSMPAPGKSAPPGSGPNNSQFASLAGQPSDTFAKALAALRGINGPPGSLPPDWYAQQGSAPDSAYGRYGGA